MVAFYVMKIKDGTITIEDVPELWRSKVEAALKE
ncbi:CD1375 family protein [Blautia argi]|nr:CD1375 family protein [Blautia argi]